MNKNIIIIYMSRVLFSCCGYKIRLRFVIFFFVAFIIINCCQSTVEGLTNGIINNVLLGVGADYQLSTYTGTTWSPIERPRGLAKPMLLAITLGPDGNLYAAGNDFRLYKSEGGAWVKARQPTGLQIISVVTEKNKLIVIGQDYKLYIYDIPTATVNPLPGPTAPVISALSFEGAEFGVKTDHKLYKWVNNQWALYDGNAPTKDVGLINITQYNGKLYGVGTDKKMYIYGGAPGKWTEAAGNKGIQLLSIYSLHYGDYRSLFE